MQSTEPPPRTLSIGEAVGDSAVGGAALGGSARGRSAGDGSGDPPHRRPQLSLVWLFAAAVLLGCPRDTRPHGSTQATLFISASLRGSLAPCGCSEHMRGGITRAAGQLAAARAAGARVFYLDAGDSLFGAASWPEAAVPQQERKAQALAQAFTAMGLAARAPGPLDDARGAAFRRRLGLPELAPGDVRWLELDGARVVVVSAADLKAAQALATALRERAAFVLALLPASMETALRDVASADAIDLVVAARPRDELAGEVNRLTGGPVRVAQLQDKGRSLLRVDLTLPTSGRAAWLAGAGERDRELAALDERIELLRAQVDAPGLDPALKALKGAKLDEVVARRAALADEPLAAVDGRNVATARFVPLEPGLPEDPAVAAITRAYDRDVGLLNVAWAQAHEEACEPADLQRGGFVGSEACVGCHPAAASSWKQTKHLRSYRSLVEKEKQYHLDCIGCHVTGWLRPGGVCRIDDVEGRAEVGCESCHGPGWRHTQLPVKEHILRARDEQACTGCHDRENSPHFEYESYRREVVSPGHGLPLDGGTTGSPFRGSNE